MAVADASFSTSIAGYIAWIDKIDSITVLALRTLRQGYPINNIEGIIPAVDRAETANPDIGLPARPARVNVYLYSGNPTSQCLVN
jgi:hypothetical protein